ncbi:autotransporter outer membrane beta-barrel domain-containing protein [Sutterella sp.]|uniref:autotransporter outer membrane beta-barrel domain-containing protein n=1 Tax=Sutterella sp. TaxID=1981025 RepID=UPI00283E4279|nr:autotransporter outer membrane beta-barrel domain-containing protein [Sutterella sp.]MDR3966050.1 autotransporter outer membrane beta-barrel domain-containing protein [Sutterella sp.]
MISKTVLSTAVTLALSAGFVSAQSISANGTFDSNFSQDCTIAENVSNLVFDITPGKVPPTNADKKLYAFGNENEKSPMVVNVLSSDITVTNNTKTGKPTDGIGAVLGGAKFIGSGGKATLISELDVLKDFHNEISGFTDLTITSRTANAIYFGGDSSTAKLSAKHITLNGKVNAIYISQENGTSANNVTIDGFDSLVMTGDSRYAVRNVGIGEQAIALTGNENSAITLTGARGAIDTGYVDNGELIGNGSGSVSVTAGKVTLETTGITEKDKQEGGKNSDFGIVHVQGGSVTINSDELTIRPAASATDWDANAFKLTKGELKINGTDGNSPAVMNVQGAIDASGEAKAELNFTGAQSSLTGRIANEADSVKILFSDAAVWNAKGASKSKNLTVSSGGIVNLTNGTSADIEDLSISSGIVSLEQKASLSATNLRGTGGTIHLSVSRNSGDDGKITYEAGSFTAEKVANDWTGANVQVTGVTADDITDLDAETAAILTHVGANIREGGTATIEGGDVLGEIEITTGADGSISIGTIGASDKVASLSDGQSIATLQWRHEMNDLTKRMGELRDSPAGIGAWARLYGSEQEYGKKNVTLRSTSVQVGADYQIGEWTVGGAFSYTNGSVDYAQGSGDADTYGFAAYGSWFAQNGMFFDLIAKYSRLSNDFEIADMKGSIDNNAYSFSAEFGWRFDLAKTLFVEPQVELTYGRILGDNATASNNVRIEQEDFDSLLGRVGLRAGFKCPNDRGTVYVRVSGVHDFKGESDVRYSSSKASTTVHDDIGGSWVEYALGANVNITPSTYTYLDLERTSGSDVKENWRWNIGLRTVF